MRTLWIVMLGLCACKGHSKAHVQSFKDGVQALCDVPGHVPLAPTAAERIAGAKAWVAANVTNPDVQRLGGVDVKPELLAAAVEQAGLSQCTLINNDLALQNFEEALKDVCKRGAQAQVLNPKVRMLVEGDAPPAKRIADLRAAVASANLGACPYLEKLQAVPAANAPTVTGLGLVELAPSAISITASDAGVVVAGKPVDRAKLDAAMTELAAARSTLTRVQILVAPALTAQVLDDLVDAISHAGYKDLALVVNADGVSRAIPFTRSDVATGKGVRPIVAIDATTFRLSSADGSEGTAQQPKATLASPAQLAAALTELATRRWNGKRTDEDRWLYVTIDPATPIQRVADALAVVRATKDGGELFPRIAITH